jgi:hypothetical protein
MNQSVVNCIESVDGLNIYSFMSFDNLKTYAKVNSLNKYECNSSLNEKLIDVDGSASPSSNDNDTSSNAKTSKTYNTRSKLNKTPKTQDINSETNSNNSNSNQAWLVRQFGNEDDYLKRLDDNLTNEDNNSSIIDDNDEEAEREEDADTEENNETEKNTAYNLNTRSRSVKSSNVIWQPTISKAGLKNNNPTNKTKMNKRSLSSSGSSRSSTSSTQSNNSLPECGKEHCRLGCICEALNLSTNAHSKKSANISSISSSKNIFSTGSSNEDSLVYRDHCGRYECMFECTCTRRLRSTTRLIQQTSQSAEGRHRNRNSESKSDSKAKHTKKSSKNASKSSQSKAISKPKSSSRKASSSVSSTNSNNQSRSSSVSSDRSESGSVSSSLSSSSASSSSDSNLNSNEPNEEYGANKLRKSKRVKHLIRRAEESHAKKKKSTKFEDDYYYYYANSSQMNSKSKNKLNNKKSSDGNKPKKAKSNEEEEAIIKTEAVESGEQILNGLSGFSSIQKPTKSKCKLDKILNKLNKNNALKNLDKDVRSLIKNAEPKNKKEADTQSASTAFKPYTQSILLKVQSNSLKTSQSKSIPLTIEVLTSKWQKNTQLVGKAMKLIARLLQQLESLNESKKEVNCWKELEFDYENELSVKMFASHRISAKVLNSSTNNEDKSDVEIERIKPTVVRVMKFKREEKKENASQSKLLSRIEPTVFKSISDLISNSSSSLVAFVSNDPIASLNTSGNNSARKEPFKIIKERFMNTSRANEPEFSRESLISSMPVGQAKILPRILCTNRRKRREWNFNKVKTLSIIKPNSSNTVLNKTGLMLKQVDSLFEKIKTSPTLDKTTATLLASILPKNDKSKKQTQDCFESISPSLLGYRPARVKFSPSNALISSENLYDDEIKHLSALSQKTKQAELDYPFYQPFKDEKLITDLYKSQNSRDLVDSVCHVVNDMINVVCVYNKNKTTTANDAKSNAQTSQIQIPPAIKKLTILPNLNHLKAASLLHSNKADSELTFNLVSLNKPGATTPPASNPSSKPIIIINSNKNANNESASKKIEQTPLINSSISSMQPIKLANASEKDNAMAKPSDIKYKTLIKILPSDKGAGPNITLKNQMVKLSSSLLTSTKLTQITPTTSSTAPTASSVMPRIINTNSTFTRPLILKSLCSISKNSLSSNRNEVDDFDNEAFKAEVSLPIKMANNKAANPALQTPPCITSFVPIRPKPDQSSSLHQQQIIRLEMKKIPKSPEMGKSSAEVTNCSNEELSEGRKRKRKQTFISYKADIQSNATQGLGANEEVRDKSKIRIVQCLENSKQPAHNSPLKISAALFKSANKAKDVKDIDHQGEDETNDSFSFHYYDSDEDIEKNDEDESMPKTSKYNGKVLVNNVPE